MIRQTPETHGAVPKWLAPRRRRRRQRRAVSANHSRCRRCVCTENDKTLRLIVSSPFAIRRRRRHLWLWDRVMNREVSIGRIMLWALRLLLMAQHRVAYAVLIPTEHVALRLGTIVASVCNADGFGVGRVLHGACTCSIGGTGGWLAGSLHGTMMKMMMTMIQLVWVGRGGATAYRTTQFTLFDDAGIRRGAMRIIASAAPTSQHRRRHPTSSSPPNGYP